MAGVFFRVSRGCGDVFCGPGLARVCSDFSFPRLKWRANQLGPFRWNFWLAVTHLFSVGRKRRLGAILCFWLWRLLLSTRWPYLLSLDPLWTQLNPRAYDIFLVASPIAILFVALFTQYGSIRSRFKAGEGKPLYPYRAAGLFLATSFAIGSWWAEFPSPLGFTQFSGATAERTTSMLGIPF